jgi:acetolactate synthase-1/2/3 large subunit
MGRLGMAGQRGANLAVQNCDLLIAIGSHLCVPQTTTLFDAFARDAKIAMVDIDHNELDHQTVEVDLPIHSDAKAFIQEVNRGALEVDAESIRAWVEHSGRYRKHNEVPSALFRTEGYINSYAFADILSDQLQPSDYVVVDGGGTALYTGFQGMKLKEGQRMTCSSAMSSMGTGLPESIGTCLANGKQRTICIIGDGSLQLNIQELETIVHHQLPIKIFVINNDGYLAIRHTQAGFLESNFVGTDEAGGLSLPDSVKIAQAYGAKAIRVTETHDLPKMISWVLDEEGPVLCDIVVSPEQEMIVKQGFVSNPDGTFTPLPLEDMAPHLDRDEFSELMLVEPWPKASS